MCILLSLERSLILCDYQFQVPMGIFLCKYVRQWHISQEKDMKNGKMRCY
jgi:hypothetical protein